MATRTTVTTATVAPAGCSTLTWVMSMASRAWAYIGKVFAKSMIERKIFRCDNISLALEDEYSSSPVSQVKKNECYKSKDAPVGIKKCQQS